MDCLARKPNAPYILPDRLSFAMCRTLLKSPAVAVDTVVIRGKRLPHHPRTMLAGNHALSAGTYPDRAGLLSAGRRLRCRAGGRADFAHGVSGSGFVEPAGRGR